MTTMNSKTYGMSNINQLMAYLDRNGIGYRMRTHPPDIDVPKSEQAKTIVIQAGTHKWIVAVCADRQPDLKNIGQVLKASDVSFVATQELEDLFPNCDTGAIPPLGNLYGLPVLVDRTLADNVEIAFYACTQAVSLQMKFKSFVRLVKPTIAVVAKVHHRHHNESVGEIV